MKKIGFQAWDVEEGIQIPPKFVAVRGDGVILTLDSEDDDHRKEETVPVIIDEPTT